MPPQFTYPQLMQKLKERRALERLEGGEELEVEYKDEQEGRWFRLGGEEELRVCIDRNAEKMVLGVKALR
jgi:bud emergence protein 1